MPLLDRLTVKITDQLPSVISPKVHSVVDYGTAAAFLLFGAWAWNRDKRVATSSVGCGIFHLLTSVLTDYSGRRPDRMAMEYHARVDMGLAAMIGTMPSFMAMEDKYDARFFHVQAVVIARAAGLTDFRRTGENKQLRRIDKELRKLRGVQADRRLTLKDAGAAEAGVELFARDGRKCSFPYFSCWPPASLRVSQCDL
jgi:hypothetical protein